MSDAHLSKKPSLWVVVNESGDIVGSNMPTGEAKGEGPVNRGRPVAAGGQHVVEIEMTEEMQFVDSAATFHARIASLMSGRANRT